MIYLKKSDLFLEPWRASEQIIFVLFGDYSERFIAFDYLIGLFYGVGTREIKINYRLLDVVYKF